MSIITLTTSPTHITTDCHILDRGELSDATITIAPDVCVQYCLVSPMIPESHDTIILSRHIQIGSGSTFTGTAVMMHQTQATIITEIIWDHATSTLDLLALVTDGADISIEWIARVDLPYRHTSIRVDQTNILIGKGNKVRGVPRLEIATDDIEWGHSCRIHRLGGDVLFYLQARGLTHQQSEAMLLNSEILRHLRTIEVSDREPICHEIHMELGKNGG